MRALSPAELELLSLIVCHHVEVATCNEACRVSPQVSNRIVVDSLVKRGALFVWPCRRVADGRHGHITDLGKLALRVQSLLK